MSGTGQPESRDEIIHGLTQKAVSLWGQKRALALRERIEKVADQMLTLSNNLPHFEAVSVPYPENRPIT